MYDVVALEGYTPGGTVQAKDLAFQTAGTATAAKILSGEMAWVNGVKVPGAMPNSGAQTASLSPGGSYTIPAGYHDGTGTVTAKTKYVKQLESTAHRGFNMDSSDYLEGYEQSFTMSAAGTVYYNGLSACYSSSRSVTCEIYKNDTLVDSRNMTSSDDPVWRVRGSMVAKSFSAEAGDVIKVATKATSGTHAIATIYATIVYFA